MNRVRVTTWKLDKPAQPLSYLGAKFIVTKRQRGAQETIWVFPGEIAHTAMIIEGHDTVVGRGSIVDMTLVPAHDSGITTERLVVYAASFADYVRTTLIEGETDEFLFHYDRNKDSMVFYLKRYLEITRDGNASPFIKRKQTNESYEDVGDDILHHHKTVFKTVKLVTPTVNLSGITFMNFYQRPALQTAGTLEKLGALIQNLFNLTDQQRIDLVQAVNRLNAAQNI